VGWDDTLTFFLHGKVLVLLRRSIEASLAYSFSPEATTAPFSTALLTIDSVLFVVHTMLYYVEAGK
jgi:hypothetical protein